MIQDKINSFFKRPSSHYFFYVLILIVPLVLVTFYKRPREEDFIFVLINAAILYLPIYFIKYKKAYTSILIPILFFPAFFEFGHILLYQGRLTESIFFILFDTNPAESQEYIESNISFKIIAFSLLYLGAVLFYWIKLLRSEVDMSLAASWKKITALVVILPFVFKLAVNKANLQKTIEPYRRASQLVSMFYYYYLYKKEMKLFANFADSLQKDFKIERQAKSDEETYILVIGESTTRNNMSLYGYHRNTTPKLSKLKNNLQVFDNVASSSYSTLNNLKNIMTLANLEDKSTDKLSVSLINILKSTGFKTYWVSNQSILGRHDTIISVFARQTDQYLFTNTNMTVSFDEEVLPTLQKYLEQPEKKKFIVVHLIGTHMKYRYRYPSEFQHFNNFDDIPRKAFHNEEKLRYINEYDNAVYYQDNVISKIFDLSMKYTKYGFTIYLSDHGEEVYKTKDLHGHPPHNASADVYEVPFLVWASNAYQAKNKIPWKNFLNRPYITDDLIHTLFEMTEIKPPFFDPSRSLINDSFKPRNRSHVPKES